VAQLTAHAKPCLASLNLIVNLIHLASSATLSLALIISSSAAEPAPPTVSARDIASRLSAQQEGTSYVRMLLEIKQSADNTKIALQVQIKERRTKTTADVAYQVLWPKERKGEAVLLHQSEGRPPTGALFVPPDKPRPLTAAQMSNPLFGSNLACQDIIEDFFAWENQAIVGSEIVNSVNCVILESKPGKGDHSIYSSVHSWIDVRRLVPLRVEKLLPSGKLARRFDTTRVAPDDKGRSIPANLAVQGGKDNSTTELDGSRIKHDVNYTDHDFSPEGLADVSAPQSPPR
jgi:hypothetical protein